MAMAATPSLSPATTYYLAPDVPATLGGVTYTPNQVVRADGGVYTLAVTFDPAIAIAALDRAIDGTWLFVPSIPVVIGGSAFGPRDVVTFDGTSYGLFASGSSMGIPDDARIDGVSVAGTELWLSFDVPVTLGGASYSQNDVVAWSGGAFTLAWDGDGAPAVPSFANASGAARPSAGSLVFAFDVAVDLAGATYVPGQLVLWNGAWASYAGDPGWPQGVLARAIALLPPPGAVPDGNAVPGTPLMAAKNGPRVALSWGPSCAPVVDDYEVYEGALGSFTSHTPLACSTGGATATLVTPGSDSRYYLVVARNGGSEGSYGTDSSGAERPASAAACIVRRLGDCP